MFTAAGFIATLLAYLIGSISSAIIVCKLLGLRDPRQHGSKNPGATNVLRIGGKFPAALVLFGDVMKGFLPVFLSKWYGIDEFDLALITLAAFLGHLFPLYYRFEGGKGVATLLGCLLALSWPTALCWMTTWVVLAVFFRYSSLSAMIACIMTPIYIWAYTKNIVYVDATIVMGLLVLYRHKSNIRQLWAGTESKLGARR